MNEEQQRFLEQLAMRIPRLFEAIRQGNVKSEYIVGVRQIGARHVRLKLVAEVVDPGANPLESHGLLRSVVVRAEIDDVGSALQSPAPDPSPRTTPPQALPPKAGRRALKAKAQAVRNSDCVSEPPPASRQPHPWQGEGAEPGSSGAGPSVPSDD